MCEIDDLAKNVVGEAVKRAFRTGMHNNSCSMCAQKVIQCLDFGFVKCIEGRPGQSSSVVKKGLKSIR